MEIIDLLNPNFKCDILVPDDIPHRWGSVGGILNNKIIICGGINLSGDFLR